MKTNDQKCLHNGEMKLITGGDHGDDLCELCGQCPECCRKDPNCGGAFYCPVCDEYWHNCVCVK